MNISRFFLWVWTAFWVALSIYLAGPLVKPVSSEVDRHALDFRMRYNEASCVRNGKDPFLMWNGTLPRGEYIAWDFSLALTEENTKIIHAYPPWEYVWMLPLTFLRQDVAERIFWILSWGGLLFVCVSAFLLGRRQMKGALWAGFAALSSVLLINHAMNACLMCQNYGILITAAVLGAILCHQSRHESWAGLFWAFALIKPQIGAIFFVPLVIQRRWRTIFIAVAITITFTCIAALLCTRSPIDMILAISKYSQGQFRETGLIPLSLFQLLVKQCGDSVLMLGSAILGLGLCVCLSLILRPCEDVWEWTMPAVFFSTLWTASRVHDQTIYAVMFLALVLSVFQRKQLRTLLVDMALIILTLSRGIDDTLHLPVNIFLMCALAVLTFRTIGISRIKNSVFEIGERGSPSI